MHLVSATDHQRFQAVIQPALARELRSSCGKQLNKIAIDRLVAIAKPSLEVQEPWIGQLRWLLLDHKSEQENQATAYAARSLLASNQIQPGGK